MPVEAFAAEQPNSSILRVYTLRLSYEYCRQLDKDKSISAGLASHCVIIRQKPVLNKTDFGYKEELKTASQTKTFMKSQPITKVNPLFGMLLVENIETYFGNVFDYENMGPKLFLFVKLMKVLQNFMPFNSNLCFTYNFNPNICKYEQFLTFVKSEGITCWKVGPLHLQKNGYSYESEFTRKFYEIYEIQQDNQGEENNQQEAQKNKKK